MRKLARGGDARAGRPAGWNAPEAGARGPARPLPPGAKPGILSVWAAVGAAEEGAVWVGAGAGCAPRPL